MFNAISMSKSGHFTPSEKAVLVYLAITGLLIVFQFPALPDAIAQLLIRAVIMVVILLFAFWQSKRTLSPLAEMVRFAFPLVLLTFLYSETDTLNNFIFREDLDPFFSHIEASLFGMQPSLVFAERLPFNGFAEAMYFGYFSYYVMLAAVPMYVFLKEGKQAGNRVMFIVIHSFFVYYLIFILFPVGGPQFYYISWPVLPEGYFFGSIMRFIQAHGEAPTAAFPSSHVSVCIMLILLSYRHARPRIKFLLPVAVLLVLSTVYIRAHYLIDVLAAFLVTPLIYFYSGFIYKRVTS